MSRRDRRADIVKSRNAEVQGLMPAVKIQTHAFTEDDREVAAEHGVQSVRMLLHMAAKLRKTPSQAGWLVNGVRPTADTWVSVTDSNVHEVFRALKAVFDRQEAHGYILVSGRSEPENPASSGMGILVRHRDLAKPVLYFRGTHRLATDKSDADDLGQWVMYEGTPVAGAGMKFDRVQQ